MENLYRYEREAIARSTYALCRAPYALLMNHLEDLEDLLFLAALAMRLEDTATHGVMWTREHQDLILSDRNDGHTFSETVGRAINLITATTWVNDFLAAVAPETSTQRRQCPTTQIPWRSCPWDQNARPSILLFGPLS